MRRIAAVGACLSTCAAWLVLGGLAGSASAAPIGQCTSHTGTIVAVDFSHWGGPIVRGCGLHQKTGYDLLHAAGFSSAGDQHDGPAFICRLGDQVFHDGTQYPTPEQDNCILTPPASAYWTYWLAPAGQNHWDYSQLGAMSETPKPGEVELWIFGGTSIAGTHGSGVPPFSPVTLRARNATPAAGAASGRPRTSTTTSSSSSTTTRSSTATTTTTTTTTTTPVVPTSTAAAGPTDTSTTATRPPPAARRAATHRRRRARSPAVPRRPRRRTRRESSTSSTATSTDAAPESTGPAVVDARPTTQHASSGSAAPLVIGITLAALLCAGAGWTVWRRRRYE